MPEKCNICDNVYSNKSNRARHKSIVHNDEKGKPVYRCSLSPVTHRQISEIQSHLSDCHNRFTNLCHYCNLSFNDENLFNVHIRKQHVLPVLDNSRVVNQLCINRDINNNNINNINNEVPSQSRPLKRVFSLIVLYIVSTPWAFSIS